MKIGEFLSKTYKDEIPFLLYHGDGKGYKISCLECEFFKPNEKRIWQCNSIFIGGCRKEFDDWLEKEMSNEY